MQMGFEPSNKSKIARHLIIMITTVIKELNLVRIRIYEPAALKQRG